MIVAILLVLLLLFGCNAPNQEMQNMMKAQKMADRVVYFKDARHNCFAGVYSVTDNYDDIVSISYVPKENCK